MINPFEKHPLTPTPPSTHRGRYLATAVVLEAVDRAILNNFDERAHETASYVAVDNVLKFLKHTLEDMAHE